jgi:hypothetical protein
MRVHRRTSRCTCTWQRNWPWQWGHVVYNLRASFNVLRRHAFCRTLSLYCLLNRPVFRQHYSATNAPSTSCHNHDARSTRYSNSNSTRVKRASKASRQAVSLASFADDQSVELPELAVLIQLTVQRTKEDSLHLQAKRSCIGINSAMHAIIFQKRWLGGARTYCTVVQLLTCLGLLFSWGNMKVSLWSSWDFRVGTNEMAILGVGAGSEIHRKHEGLRLASSLSL